MVTWRIKSNWTPTDPDAAAYIAAVETADGQALEEKVKIAIDNFVLGCKQDGIWSAIKASCILAGARTLDGALVPLVGTAPTNYNFVAGDYNRETGLKGNASTKYLDSNRDNAADPQNNSSRCAFVTTALTGGSLMGSDPALTGHDYMTDNGGLMRYRNRDAQVDTGNSRVTGFFGTSRSSSTSWSTRSSGSTVNFTSASATPASSNLRIFTRWFAGAPNAPTDARIAFYSIGESLDLQKLDARVTDLVNAIGAAIP